MLGVTIAAPPHRPIDETLAIAGNFKHGKANPRGCKYKYGPKTFRNSLLNFNQI